MKPLNSGAALEDTPPTSELPALLPGWCCGATWRDPGGRARLREAQDGRGVVSFPGPGREAGGGWCGSSPAGPSGLPPTELASRGPLGDASQDFPQEGGRPGSAQTGSVPLPVEEVGEETRASGLRMPPPRSRCAEVGLPSGSRGFVTCHNKQLSPVVWDVPARGRLISPGVPQPHRPRPLVVWPHSQTWCQMRCPLMG